MTKRSPRREPRYQPPPARPDWIVAGLAAVGLVVALYLAWTKWSGSSALFCTAGSGCDVVQASRYSMFLGLPVGAWGAFLYAVLAGLALAGLSEGRWLIAFLVSVAGVSFSAYLTFIELFVLNAVCFYCVTSAVIMLAVFVTLLLRRPPATRRKSPLRPARVATAGVLVAIATIVFGAGVYATPTAPASAYQEALARHLATSGAVMYGAYW